MPDTAPTASTAPDTPPTAPSAQLAAVIAAARRIVLGDWDSQGWALQIDEQGLHQAPFALA